MKPFNSQITLITGVGRSIGIGAAICREIAKNGGDIFFTYWNEYDKQMFPNTPTSDTQHITNELKQYGVRVESCEFDLSKPEAAATLFKQAEDTLGTPTILINNACRDIEIPFTELTPEILDKHYAVNQRAVTMLCSEFVKRQNAGNIINLISGQSLGSMGENQISYTTTKAAVDMLALQLAPELSKLNIRINSLDPGPVDTGWMTEDIKQDIIKASSSGKISLPKDTAQLIMSILLDKGKKTGQTIHAQR
ncbi:MAG: SDR family NAD(P)-dependent oxidoreductase [Alphaproteobacteria bacterium]|nr:SDR family NAD(P)-dependent oxidoreductase [Alphaproteobacteria bacterium]